MNLAIAAAALFGVFTLALHLFSLALAAKRCRPQLRLAAPKQAAPVTIIRPVCGLENHLTATLRSTFTLDYPAYEILFCVATPTDPVIALVERLIDEHPQVPARLLIGDERINGNPKLNNVLKGWRAARHDWVVIADSNVLMPPDYLQRLIAVWREDTGLVCSPPVGCRPEGFAAALECAFLNTHQARWQYAADTLGFGFAQGKTMLWKHSELERAGGIGRLAAELAEDAASTKVVRGTGKKVRLVDGPFEQPLGRRTLAEVWRRQVRWARLRRASFSRFFLPESIAGGVVPLIPVAFVAAALDVPELTFGFVALWYGAELALAFAAGWPLSLLTPICALIRDAMLPALWISAFTGSAFVWRGNAMQVARAGATPEA